MISHLLSTAKRSLSKQTILLKILRRLGHQELPERRQILSSRVSIMYVDLVATCILSYGHPRYLEGLRMYLRIRTYDYVENRKHRLIDVRYGMVGTIPYHTIEIHLEIHPFYRRGCLGHTTVCFFQELFQALELSVVSDIPTCPQTKLNTIV